MHILDKPLDLPEQGADKVLSGASKVGRRDRGHAKNPVFSQFLLSDGTPLITSKSVCQQPANSATWAVSAWETKQTCEQALADKVRSESAPRGRGEVTVDHLAGKPRVWRRFGSEFS